MEEAAVQVKMEETYAFKGFDIPVRLMAMTGAGVETWEGISANHIAHYERYCPIQATHNVLEIGCGVGRDAIPLASKLQGGKYVGVDIMKEHIEWCQNHITRRYPDFEFLYVDVRSDDYNPNGSLTTLDVDYSSIGLKFDRIILQSVFTHMLEEEVTHYLSQFRCMLAPEGVVFATFFILNTDKHRAAKQSARYKFLHMLHDGLFVQDLANPRRVVAYAAGALSRVLSASGLKMQGLHHGYWAGTHRATHFQDIILFSA